MISNRWSKIIKSLQIKKFRKEHDSFLVEGEKGLRELLESDLKIDQLFLTPKFVNSNEDALKEFTFELCEQKEIEKVTSLVTNDSGIAVVKIPVYDVAVNSLSSILLLDNIQDPGNLGTIIRIADWYNIDLLVCSKSTVDQFNPKVVQSAMGSLFRKKIVYTDLEVFIRENEDITFYAATLHGENLHENINAEARTAFVLGNESKGVSQAVIDLCDKELTIPRFGEAESLNVGTATAIICDNYRRIMK